VRTGKLITSTFEPGAVFSYAHTLRELSFGDISYDTEKSFEDERSLYAQRVQKLYERIMPYDVLPKTAREIQYMKQSAYRCAACRWPSKTENTSGNQRNQKRQIELPVLHSTPTPLRKAHPSFPRFSLCR